MKNVESDMDVSLEPDRHSRMQGIARALKVFIGKENRPEFQVVVCHQGGLS